MMTAVHPQIRWFIRRDMPEVLDIEQRAFEQPWTEEDYLPCLRQRNCIGIVAELDQRIVGCMVYMLEKSELRLLNFVVDPSFRRRGIGTAMLQKMKAKLSQQRRSRIRVYARERNLGVQLFWRAMGFRAVGVDRGYYEDTGEDAYVMVYALDGDEEFALPSVSRFDF